MHYRRFDHTSPARPWKERRYVAYVLRREGPPGWVPLGEAEPIEAAIAAALDALTRRAGETRERLRALDELIFAPVRRRLRASGSDSSDHFLLSPDGDLHRVPFAALVDEEGRCLVEYLRIGYLGPDRWTTG